MSEAGPRPDRRKDVSHLRCGDWGELIAATILLRRAGGRPLGSVFNGARQKGGQGTRVREVATG